MTLRTDGSEIREIWAGRKRRCGVEASFFVKKKKRRFNPGEASSSERYQGKVVSERIRDEIEMS